MDFLARLNNLRPLGPAMVHYLAVPAITFSPIPTAIGVDGWFAHRNSGSGYVLIENSGLTFRYRADRGQIRVDIAAGLRVPGGALQYDETCHYHGG